VEKEYLLFQPRNINILLLQMTTFFLIYATYKYINKMWNSSVVKTGKLEI